MSAQLNLPEAVRADLFELNRVAQQAQRDLNVAASMAYRFLGLDPAGKHVIELSSGVVTPEAKEPATEPTPIRAEA